MKSYKAQTNWLLLVAAMMLALMPVSAFADDKDDLYAKGMKAIDSGKAIDARDAFCALAKKDNEYKDAQKQCDAMTKEADKVLNRNKKTYGEASDALAAGRYDEAETKFKQVLSGEYVALAKAKLQEIAKVKQDKLNADKAASDQASSSNSKFDQGATAFGNGKFEEAKTALAGITGPRAAEAKEILQKISRYETFMQQAATFAQNKNYSAAANSYNFAIGISPNGPDNPQAKFDDMQSKLASASATPANNPAPTTTAPAPNKNALAAANKDQIEKVDENKLVQDAKQLVARKKYPQARRLLDKVLAQNFKNPAALDLMKSLPQPAAQPLTSATATDEDPVLAAAISKFYAANYDDAEAQLGFYVSQVGPKKPGLGNFYLGVSLLTRFYLSGESDQSLRLKAIRRFSDAKAIAGFKAPEKLVSPKILAIYREAKGPAATATP